MLDFANKSMLNRQISIVAFQRTKKFDLTPKTREVMNIFNKAQKNCIFEIFRGPNFVNGHYIKISILI